MQLAERVFEKAKGTDFPDLKYMKGVKEALEAQVTGPNGAVDLGKLLQASPEAQRVLVENAFDAAEVEYGNPLNSNHVKLTELAEVRKALNEGRLTVTGLLEGLELKAKPVESSKSKGIFGRIKESLHRSART